MDLAQWPGPVDADYGVLDFSWQFDKTLDGSENPSVVVGDTVTVRLPGEPAKHYRVIELGLVSGTAKVVPID